MRLLNIVLAGAGMLALGGVAAAQYRSSTEEPGYVSVVTDGAIELRDYDALLVAEVTHTGDRRQAASAGFRRLAAYIFAQERPGAEGAGQIAMTSPVIQDQTQKIAMTAPVLQDSPANAGDVSSWRTRFVMPSEYTLDTLPEAAEDITLTEIPARRLAAIRFSGNGNAADLREQEAALRDWIEAKELEPLGDAEFAFYDAPMVPARFRRNEVMIPVAAD